MMQMGVEGEVAISPLSAFYYHGNDKLIKMMLTTQDKRVTQRVRNRTKMLAERRADERRKIKPHRPYHEVMPDGAWRGERCFVIGGGPSLEGFDFNRLQGKGRVIAINKAFKDVMFADICFFMDASSNTFYGLLKRGRLGQDILQKWEEFQGDKVYLNLVGRKLDDVYSVRSIGRAGVSNSIAKGLYHGNNSGVGAIGLAICLRANPIYLLGFDCGFSNGKSHYHGGYPMGMKESIFRGFANDFSRFNKFLIRTKFRVINLNPKSHLRCFPFSTIDEVLGNGKTG